MRTVLAVTLLALVLLYVWERVEVVRVGYHIERLKAQKVTLQRERDELQVKVSSLTSPERIARLAKERLGMLPPQHGQVVLVALDRRLPTLATAPAEMRLAKRDSMEIVR